MRDLLDDSGDGAQRRTSGLPPTFSQLQQQGYARPVTPQYQNPQASGGPQLEEEEDPRKKQPSPQSQQPPRTTVSAPGSQGYQPPQQSPAGPAAPSAAPPPPPVPMAAPQAPVNPRVPVYGNDGYIQNVTSQKGDIDRSGGQTSVFDGERWSSYNGPVDAAQEQRQQQEMAYANSPQAQFDLLNAQQPAQAQQPWQAIPGGPQMANAAVDPMAGQMMNALGAQSPVSAPQASPGQNTYFQGGQYTNNYQQAQQLQQGSGGGGQAPQGSLAQQLMQRLSGPGYQNPMGAETQQFLKQWMQNPSSYGSDLANQTYEMMKRNLDRDYNTRGRQLDERMAGRGLWDSTIAGQNYGDLAAEQGYAMSDMATNILREQAGTNAQDRNSLMSGLLGYGNQGLNAAQFNEGATSNRYNQALGYDQDLFNRSATTHQINNQQDQDMIRLWMQLLGAG